MKKFLAVFSISAAFLFSQGNTSRLDGTVTDPVGAAVPGAEVAVINAATGQTIKTTTNDQGEFAVPTIPAATYRVTVTKPGFKAGLVAGVELNAGVPGTVNVKLEIGQSTETVEVVGGVRADFGAAGVTIDVCAGYCCCSLRARLRSRRRSRSM
jgi:hypothetical protein